MYKKLLLAAALMLAGTTAYSIEGWMNVHLASSHIQPVYYDKGQPRIYNQNNFGIGLAIPVSEKLDAITGFYDNSYNETSIYAGVNYHTANKYGLSAGINLGLVSGYDDTPNTDYKVIVMLVPHITYAVKNLRTEFGFIPSYGVEGKTSAMTLTVGTRF